MTNDQEVINFFSLRFSTFSAVGRKPECQLSTKINQSGKFRKEIAAVPVNAVILDKRVFCPMNMGESSYKICSKRRLCLMQVTWLAATTMPR